MKILAALCLALIAAPALAQDFVWTPVQGATGYSGRCTLSRAPTKQDAPFVTVITASAQTPRLPTGNYQCAFVAINQNGESDFSNVLPMTCTESGCRVPVPQAPVVTAPLYKVAAIAGQTTRPLYTDVSRATKLGSITFDKECEGGPALQKTTAGEWRWATNNVGDRGVTLCKEVK